MEALGGSIAAIRPGSHEAREVKEVLSKRGMWSQYLEVGLGPDPEVFTKAAVLSSVGFGADIGIPDFSEVLPGSSQVTIFRGAVRMVLAGLPGWLGWGSGFSLQPSPCPHQRCGGNQEARGPVG